MKVRHVIESVQRDGRMIVGSDVSRDEVTMGGRLRCQVGGSSGVEEWRDDCGNDTVGIEAKLVSLAKIAAARGFSGLLVVAEPTGGYEQLLLRTAKRLGHEAAYVSGEAVSLSRTIEYNDTGKTDQRDPLVIAALAERGRLMKFRDRREDYGELKVLHRWYLQADEDCTSLRCRINTRLVEVWPDLKPEKDFMYGTTGQALLSRYGCDPQAIAATGRKRFETYMRKAAPRVRAKTLIKLFEAAEATARNPRPEGIVSIMVKQLVDLNRQYVDRNTVRDEIRRNMEAVYARMKGDDPRLPDPEPGVINAFGLARFFAETGPLDDYKSLQQLLKYAGLNLRERKSGTFAGSNRISKKGSSHLRLVLSRLIFPLIRKVGLFGTEYHARKAAGTPGPKAQVVFMRRMLKLLYGWYNSGSAFDLSRVLTCESQYKSKSKVA